ncbi:hypothetical protein HanIR_Chr09g0432931 [Helianthus annuus]|nr:hypothetical protein HanIR_Chr09g0432931 [Helianthus annuus]
MNVCTFAAVAAAITSASVAPSFPYAMFSIMVVANSAGSCWTRPIFNRRDFRFNRLISFPSIITFPAVGS